MNTGSLKRFFDNIPKIGTPPKITQDVLPTLGFKSSADRPIITILKFIGFLNEKSEPNQAYRDFKTANKAGSVMSIALKKAYADLFEIYPNGCEQDDQSLKNFFTPTTDAGEQIVQQTVATFKVLCNYADFKAAPSAEEGGEEEKKKGKDDEGEKPKPSMQTGVVLNVNIQLSLPITEDASVYDKIFKAIKDNLVSRD